MTGQGHQLFADQLTAFAAATADQRIQPVAERAAEPLRVVVRGRRGVGCSTVAHALGRAGVPVASHPDAADVQVYVLAEVLKPEDRDAIAAANAAGGTVVVVLNKADLTGFTGAGPMAAARTRCAHLAALVGQPVEPLIGLLAVAALDDLDEPCWPALRALAADPAGLACLDQSFDGFLAGDLGVPTDTRLQLIEALDLFGIAVGVAGLRRGGTPARVRALLRTLSGIDAVVAKLTAAGAEVRYRQVLEAVAALEALAVTDECIGEFLSCDATVMARMAAALDVADACGLSPAMEAVPSAGPAAHLQRAMCWQRGRQAAWSDLHRACAADVTRGSLRQWAQAGGSAQSGASQ
ncbi:hypothetical protein F0Q45_05125 [Mycobacterium simiae]|uniref:Uncharacterized protein n=1 Tax=Mycobacterium simiae TaxID=1784 RepID=A0A5B1BV06_MYCSI|nr:hypothetical protein [Mycobacterium simiae]KAA1251280.1 hypothetical protein F0Q45_05125 [Mycobacterium simiae]